MGIIRFHFAGELIAAIEKDISYAKEKLQEPANETFRSHEFFTLSMPPSFPFVEVEGKMVPPKVTGKPLPIPCDQCGCAGDDDK